MKTYRNFINESIRDKMTPKSKENIKNTLSKLDIKDQIKTIRRKELDFDYYFPVDDLIKDYLKGRYDMNDKFSFAIDKEEFDYSFKRWVNEFDIEVTELSDEESDEWDYNLTGTLKNFFLMFIKAEYDPFDAFRYIGI